MHHFHFDLNHIIMLAGLVLVLYVGYRIGSFVWKTSIGLFVIGVAVVATAKACSYNDGWLV